MTPRVVHCKREPHDVYIGRPSKWGNPFVIGNGSTREQVIEEYRNWINLPVQSWLLDAAKTELKGKTLGCWCSPQKCHGDVLLEIANSDSKEKP